MKKSMQFAIAAAFIVAAGAASASSISIATGSSSAAAQSSAAAYKAVVDSAVATGQSVSVSSYDNVSPQSLLGSYNDFAFKSTVNFGVTAATAGVWDIRSGVDFGKGGAIFVDGVALDTKSNDMWWAGNYNNSSQYFDISLALAAGNHTLNIYGLENCCSGNHQAQFKDATTTAYTSFSATDGLIAAAVPEPETYAMMLAGLGLVGFVARRKSSKAA